MNFIWEMILKLIGRDEKTLLKKYESTGYQKLIREKKEMEEEKMSKERLKKIRKFMKWCIRERTKGLFKGQVTICFYVNLSSIYAYYERCYMNSDGVKKFVPYYADSEERIRIFGYGTSIEIRKAFEEVGKKFDIFELEIYDSQQQITLKFKEATPAQ